MGPQVKTSFDLELEQTSAQNTERINQVYPTYRRTATINPVLFSFLGIDFRQHHLELIKILLLVSIAISISRK